jgi:hypothetical protein
MSPDVPRDEIDVTLTGSSRRGTSSGIGRHEKVAAERSLVFGVPEDRDERLVAAQRQHLLTRRGHHRQARWRR